MCISRFVFSVSVTLLAFSAVSAQPDEDYTLTIGGGLAVAGDFETSVTLDFLDGDDVQGMQFGVCHDDEIITINDGDIENGAALEDDDLDLDFLFVAVSVFDDPGAAGWTVGGLLSPISGSVIPPGEGYELYVCTYEILEATETTLEFCETLGTPEVTVRVIVDGDEIEPVAVDGEIIVDALTFTFFASDEDVSFNADTGVSSEFTTTISILEDSDDASDTQGFQMGLSWEDTELSVIQIDDTDDMLLGELSDLGPAFFGANFSPEDLPEGRGGFTVGTVYAIMGGEFIVFDEQKDVFEITFEGVPDFLEGSTGDLTAEINWDDTLGDPVLPNSVVVDGDSYSATDNVDAIISFRGGDSLFIRGDANDSGTVNGLDAYFMIEAVFMDGPDLACFAAGEVTGDEEIDLEDIIYVLEYVYLDGDDPPAPFPDCGLPADDEDCSEGGASCL